MDRAARRENAQSAVNEASSSLKWVFMQAIRASLLLQLPPPVSSKVKECGHFEHLYLLKLRGSAWRKPTAGAPQEASAGLFLCFTGARAYLRISSGAPKTPVERARQLVVHFHQLVASRRQPVAKPGQLVGGRRQLVTRSLQPVAQLRQSVVQLGQPVALQRQLVGCDVQPVARGPPLVVRRLRLLVKRRPPLVRRRPSVVAGILRLLVIRGPFAAAV